MLHHHLLSSFLFSLIFLLLIYEGILRVVTEIVEHFILIRVPEIVNHRHPHCCQGNYTNIVIIFFFGSNNLYKYFSERSIKFKT